MLGAGDPASACSQASTSACILGKALTQQQPIEAREPYQPLNGLPGRRLELGATQSLRQQRAERLAGDGDRLALDKL
jgi:hypothetical protein